MAGTGTRRPRPVCTQALNSRPVLVGFEEIRRGTQRGEGRLCQSTTQELLLMALSFHIYVLFFWGKKQSTRKNLCFPSCKMETLKPCFLAFWTMSDMWHRLSKRQRQVLLSASLSSGRRRLLSVTPQTATPTVPLPLHPVCSLSAAVNETKCHSSNYLFTSGVKIKPADRGSLEVCNLSYSLFTLLRDFQLLQVHKFLAVDQGRDCKLTWVIGLHLCTFQRFKSLPGKKKKSFLICCLFCLN